MDSNITRTVSLQEDQDHTKSSSVARTISKYRLARSKIYRELTETRQEVSRPGDMILQTQSTRQS